MNTGLRDYVFFFYLQIEMVNALQNKSYDIMSAIHLVRLFGLWKFRQIDWLH